MATGDIRNNIRKLRRQLREMKYSPDSDPQKIFDEGITEGQLASFLPIWHFAFLKYSLPVSEFISSKNFELFGKSDLRFVEIAFRVLRDLFSYKPKLTKDQMMTSGFTERKIIITYDILNLMKTKHQELERRARKPKTNLLSNRSRLFQSKSFTTGAASEASSIPVTASRIPALEATVQRHHPVSALEATVQRHRPVSIVINEVLVDESAREESSAVLEDIPVAKHDKDEDEEEEEVLRPMDDGYRSANISPVPDRGAALSLQPSSLENHIKVLEERMILLESATDSRLSQLEETVDELCRKESSDVGSATGGHDQGEVSKRGRTDQDLTTILGRLTLIESRVQLLQSQNLREIQRTLPAAKVLPSTKPASHRTLPQGHLVAGSSTLHGSAALFPDTPPTDSSSPVTHGSNSHILQHFATTALVPCAIALPNVEIQVTDDSMTAAPDSTVTSEGEPSKTPENVPESTTSLDHVHTSSENKPASLLVDQAASPLMDISAEPRTEDAAAAASISSSSSDGKKKDDDKTQDMATKYNRLTQLISETENLLGMDTSIVPSPSSDDDIYTEANSEL